MKLNNKGMTLIELLVSITLIGIVVIFLFQLLVDIKSETNNNSFAYNNQINRTELIHEIEKDLTNYTLVGISDKTVGDILIINFHFKKDNKIISSELRLDKKETLNKYEEKEVTDYFKYTNYNGEVFKWEAKGASIDSCGLFNFYKDNMSLNYYFKLNIFVYNKPYHALNNKDHNNLVDDIEITYMGNIDDLLSDENYLTYQEISNKKIGSCTN